MSGIKLTLANPAEPNPEMSQSITLELAETSRVESVTQATPIELKLAEANQATLTPTDSTSKAPESLVTSSKASVGVVWLLGQNGRLPPPTPEQIAAFTDKANQVDLSSSVSIVNYGLPLQRKFKSFTNDVLKLALNDDVNEIGTVLSRMVTKIQDLTRNSEEKHQGFFGHSNHIKAIRREYEEASKALDRTKKILEGYHLRLLVDSKTMEELYQQVLEYHQELSSCIQAGQQRLISVRDRELNVLHQRAAATNTEEDALAYHDFKSRCDSFEKRLQDLEVTRVACFQTVAQIQMIQQANRDIALKLQSSAHNAIPLWQQSIAAALAVKYHRETFASNDAKLLAVISDASSVQQAEYERRVKANAEIQQSLAAIV